MMKTERVILVNKFYYPRGGDFVVTLSTERLLKDLGIDVAAFAMKCSENVPTRWNEYFASEVSFFSGGVGSKLRAVRRIFGTDDVKPSFERLLDDFQPQVLHLGNIHSYLSPVIAQLAHRRGVRVVWTLHDYKLVCPNYSCLRHSKVCEACIGHGKWHVAANRCMKGSLAASTIGWLEAIKWNRRTLERCVDAFICPSEFMASKMRQGGFSPEKLHVLCNFVSPEVLEALNTGAATERGDYYLYVGRISPEKGVENLVEVASTLPHRLKLAGAGPLLDELKSRFARCSNIEFLGYQPQHEVAKLQQKARFVAVPSQCYENNPLSAIEALCAGTPVVGSRIGGIPELLDDDNGIVYSAFDKSELSQAIGAAMLHRWDNDAIAAKARQRFSQETHAEKLMKIYNGE